MARVYREAQTVTVRGTGVTRGQSLLRGRARGVTRATHPPTSWSGTSRAALPSFMDGNNGAFTWFQEAVIEEDNDDTKYETLVQMAVADYSDITEGVTPAMIAERQRLLRAWVTSYKTWRDV